MYVSRAVIFLLCLLLASTSFSYSPYKSINNKLLLNEETVVDKQPPIKSQESVSSPIVLDDYDRGTPRSSIEKFLGLIRKAEYVSAINYLDFDGVNNKIRKIPREKVVRTLKLVLDRALWVDLPTLSNDPAGYKNDGIPGDRDLIGYIPLQDRKVPIYAQHVAREDGVLIWKIAGVSINSLPELYREYGDGPVGEVLTKILPEVFFLGLQLWQWVTLLLIIIISIFIAVLPTKLIASLIRKRDSDMSEQIAAIVSGPVRFLIIILLIRGMCPLMSLSLEAREVTQGYTIVIIAVTWTLLSTISIVRDFFVHRLTNDNRKSAAKLLNPLSSLIKTMIVITATLVWLENLGFKASTILAGLGVGGLAFALAAQKSIENIIAGITLYVSVPVKVGNLGRFGKYIGFIEDIGMRYTKIRTLDRTLVNISNSIFVDMELENYSERNRIRYKPELVLSHESTAEQIESVIADIKQLLDDHEQICEAPCRVRLADYLEYGIALNVMSYVDTTKFPVYAEVSNELNFAILNILNKHKVRLADMGFGSLRKNKDPSIE